MTQERATENAAEKTKAKKSQNIGNAKDFRIVGIGASAGGLEALSLLLKNIPHGVKYAIVIVQHLSEKPKSMLPEILARQTSLPLSEITGATPVLPGHIYVAPAHAYVALSKNTLKLREPKGEEHFLPIDFFFSSLARAKKEKAVGVILSGTGKDGTKGLEAIREQGGATFAEDPKIATHPGMPESAIESGAVLYVLSPGKIAKKLSAKGTLRETSPVSPALGQSMQPVQKNAPARLPTDAHLREIIGLLERASNIDFSAYKEGTVKRRIARRMKLRKVEELSRYAAYVREHPEEAASLSEDILIHVTEFFRDPPLFQSLKRRVFPPLLRHREQNNAIRIWVPGCSTGEEVYSLAMSLIEFLERKKKTVPVQFFGTDVSEAALKEARRGQYGKEIEARVSPERLRRFFTKVPGIAQKYEVSKTIRNMCVFTKHNMVKDTPFSRIDIISCRNVLIYFDAELQKKAFPLFHFALKPKGFLVLGTSESISGFQDLFGEADKKYKIYSRKAAVSPFRFEFTVNAHAENPMPKKEADAFPAGRNIEKEADAIILSKHSPAGVVITRDMTILQFRGNTGAYLEPMPGRATFNVLKMVRKDFLLPLTGALDEARKTGRPARKEVIHPGETGYKKTDIEAIPLCMPGSEEKYFLILFHERRHGQREKHPGEKTGEANTRANKNAEFEISDEKNREIAKLREELTNTAEYLQSLIERQETTNEELRSANEEVMSSNEELQSANEELETAHEELQSTNEELTTVNSELGERNLELNEKNSDLKNLMEQVGNARNFAESVIDTIGEPMVVLGKTLRVQAANWAFYKDFDVSEQETKDRLFWELGDGQWNVPEITDPLKRMLSSKIKMVNIEVAHDFPRIGKRVMSLSARRIREKTAAAPKKGEAEKILFVIRDITKLKELEALREKEYGSMKNDMKDRTHKLVEVNTALVKEVAERKRLEEELRERTNTVAEGGRRTGEFLVILSLVLRNPLAHIIATVEEARLRGFGGVETEDTFNIIGRQAEQMMRLLKDLLDVSRILYGKIELIPEYVDIREVVRHAVLATEFFVTKRGHSLSLHLPDEQQILIADPLRIEQVLVNLIFNAAKYTNPGGKIGVIMARGKDGDGRDEMRIAVKDNGMGITSEVLPKIFDLFAQADRLKDKTKSGMGIGLFLAKRLAILHGGTVTAQSEGANKGSEFTLHLWVNNNLPPPRKSPKDASPTAKQKTPAKRILVADDNQDAADSLGKLLTALGRSVQIAYNGKDAIRVGKETPPDMAFIDIAMPEMDGYEVATRMRSDPDFANTKLVALTGFGQKTDTENALRAGFDFHYVKPITLAALKEIIGD